MGRKQLQKILVTRTKENSLLVPLPQTLCSMQSWKRFFSLKTSAYFKQNKMLSSRPKKRQYWYGHTEDATFQGSICIANTLSICKTKITQTYEDDKMGLSTGLSTITRRRGRKSAFASYLARYYSVSLNGQVATPLLMPLLPQGLLFSAKHLPSCIQPRCAWVSGVIAACRYTISHLLCRHTCVCWIDTSFGQSLTCLQLFIDNEY